MREYKKAYIETEELTRVLCDTCKKEIHKRGSGEAYIPPEVITVSRKYPSHGWARDNFEFCSLECFIEWAKGDLGTFDISFPHYALNTLASEYARLKDRDSRLTAIESPSNEINKEDK